VLLDGDEVSAAIRAPAVTEAASRVSVHQPVREALVAAQRRLIAAGRYVAEGRDIGTVVSPDAPLKVFLTASEEERAARRAAQTGEDPAAVLAAQRERDRRDSTREHSALRPASDAVEIDTSNLSLSEVIERVAELAGERGLTATGRR
jgi:cytidylate kinase